MATPEEIKAALRNCTALLFDFDGTLCDSEYYYFQAWSRAFETVDHTIDEADYYRTFSNLGTGPKPEIEKHQLDTSEDVLRPIRVARFKEFIEAGEIALYPAAGELLEELKLHQFRVAVCSNTPADIIRSILSVSNVDFEFESIIGTTKDLRRKPEPDVFIHALETLGLSPEEVIIFEDTQIGVSAAAKAGCQVIRIVNSHNQDLEIEGNYLFDATLAEITSSLSELRS